MEKQSHLVIHNFLKDRLNRLEQLLITARQYGEVVLPDAASGHDPDTRQLAGQKAVTVQGGYGTCFCRPGTNFIEHYACRGTSLIGARKLSRYMIFVGGTGAVSRYKLSRSQDSVTVHNLNWGQMRVSGCIYHYKVVLGVGAKAKTVTSNLPILSVLGFVFLFIFGIKTKSLIIDRFS